MPTRILPAVVTAVLVALLVTGCTPPEPELAPEPDGPTIETLFGSAEDARLAAEEALREYWAASAKVFQNPSEGSEALEALVTSRRFAQEEATAELFVEQQLVQVGAITVDSVRVEHLDASSDPPMLIVRACADYSGYSAVTASGGVAKRTTDHERVFLDVTFEVSPSSDGPRLRLEAGRPRTDRPC